jgi:hypothetical protein
VCVCVCVCIYITGISASESIGEKRDRIEQCHQRFVKQGRVRMRIELDCKKLNRTPSLNPTLDQRILIEIICPNRDY